MNEVTVALLRSLITFVGLLIFARLLGKSQISQFTFFEWVTGITVGSIAGELSTDLHVRPWPMFASLITWIALTLAMQYVTMQNRWLSKMIDGEPVVVIQNGQILEGNLRKMRIRMGEITSMLRAQGYFDPTQIEFAILEPRGDLAILPKSQYRPVTPHDLKIPTQYEGLGIELIVDGQVQDQNLRRLKVTQSWLLEKLREQCVYAVGDVFYAVIDTQGKLFIDLHRDRVPPTDDFSDFPGPN